MALTNLRERRREGDRAVWPSPPSGRWEAAILMALTSPSIFCQLWRVGARERCEGKGLSVKVQRVPAADETDGVSINMTALEGPLVHKLWALMSSGVKPSMAKESVACCSNDVVTSLLEMWLAQGE